MSISLTAVLTVCVNKTANTYTTRKSKRSAHIKAFKVCIMDRTKVLKGITNRKMRITCAVLKTRVRRMILRAFRLVTPMGPAASSPCSSTIMISQVEVNTMKRSRRHHI